MADALMPGDPSGRDAEDPFFVVYESELVDGRVRARSWVVPRSAISPGPADPPAQAGPPPEYDKLHPLLRRRLQEPDLDRREELIVAFSDQPTIPRFPMPIPGEEPDSPRMLLEQARADALVAAIRAQRAPRYDQLVAELVAIEPTLEVRERFWLINAVHVEAPLRAVERLAASPSVLSIAPRYSGEAPPSGEIVAGRSEIYSDPYYDLHLPTTRIALLDSGVLRTHALLVGRLGDCLDCTDGSLDCSGPDPDDIADHGTASAAILTANGTSGDPYRGVTAATVDSMRVYCGPTDIDRVAVQHGFALTVNSLRKVVVAEMQGVDGYHGDLALAAESAYEGGAVVVAANGNTPGARTVRSPASAHRVIGVGAYEVTSTGMYNGQSRGPTVDERVKPDVQGPTGTRSASSGSDTATAVFPATSGATPYIGGAAALLRDWNVGQPGGPTDPGQVYAQLILFGSLVSPFAPQSGAGHLHLLLDGTSWVGKVAVGNGEVVPIDIPVPAGMRKRLTAAIWWPETWQGGDVHNAVTLVVADPTGVASAEATTPKSVFERCFVERTPSMGTWQVRIRGAQVPSAPQTVYWAAFVQLSVVPHLLRRSVALVLRAFLWAKTFGRGRVAASSSGQPISLSEQPNDHLLRSSEWIKSYGCARGGLGQFDPDTRRTPDPGTSSIP